MCALVRCGADKPAKPLVLGYETKATPVSLLAYNTFLRPHVVGLWDKKAERLPANIEAASRYDVVGLSEVFDDKMRAELRRKLKVSHPYVVEPPTDPYGVREDGGIFLMSRFPIVFSRRWIYGEGAGADALSVKGVIYARLQVGTQKLDVMVTHAQSGSEHAAVRKRQFEELSRFAAEWESKDVAQVLLGDLNVAEAETGEYESMLSVLGQPWDVYRHLNQDQGFTSDGLMNALVGNSVRERIDYLLCRHCEGREDWFKTSRVEPFPLKVPAGKAKFGSDHYAVTAVMEIPQ